MFAQVYPTTATTILPPPHPIFLNDYYSVGTTHLQTSLLLKDLQEPFVNVRIQVVIEGNGLTIKTKDTYIPATPIVLSPGVPVILQGSDFYEYLQLENIAIQGSNPATFNLSGGKFPEGMYNFKVNILSYSSGAALSNDGGTMVYLFQEQPPQLLLPLAEEVIIPSNPQNILMSWQIQAGASPLLAATSQYEVFIYKITDNQANPYQTVNNGQAQKVYQSGPLLQSTFNLDLTTTALETGNKYVYNVRVLDGQGNNVYANDGYSEWRWFYYGYPTGGVIALNEPAEDKTLAKNKAKLFSWQTSDLAVSNQSFEYKIVDGVIDIEFDFFDKDIVSKFMNTLVKIVIDVSKIEKLEVILSGGVFQNKTLLEMLISELKKENIIYYSQQETAINDGGIALGQVYYHLCKIYSL